MARPTDIFLSTADGGYPDCYDMWKEYWGEHMSNRCRVLGLKPEDLEISDRLLPNGKQAFTLTDAGFEKIRKKHFE